MKLMVSADSRYGPMYNQGSAQLVLDGLQRHGYRPDGGARISLLGYSGGGQIALGSARYIAENLGTPVRVISLGGVLSSDPGIDEVEHLYHIRGEKDGVQRLGKIIFPGRWKALRNSDWNRALARGKISFIEMGPIAHNGPGGYLEEEQRLPDGRTFMEQTIDTIAELITKPTAT